mmetsp:Transcript_18695/g.18369  ORF Transcript_18695/g.18369 Transcript_18695/m.18369 type:complete len:114 (+) Transcript_18695:258-599(+)
MVRDLFDSHLESKSSYVSLTKTGNPSPMEKNTLKKIMLNFKVKNNKSMKPSKCRVSLLGALQIFGHEDSFRKRDYTTTCTCTVDGSLFVIPASHFERDLKQFSEDTYKEMIKN